MPNADKKAAKNTEAPKKERRVLTPEERIAKLEADLKAAREKAAAKSRKQIDTLLEKRRGLIARQQDIAGKIGVIDTELRSLGYEFEAPADESNVA